VTNNIAGGIAYAGFLVPAHDCDEEDTQTVFRDNVAHSALGESAGEGMIVFPNEAYEQHKTCFQASHNAFYKNPYAAVNSF
jgi:hypothetical protein